MTVKRGSRYFDGPSQQIPQKNTGTYNWTVYRSFPETVKISYVDYTWVYGDRMDYLAAVYLGDATQWWRIMDINPTLEDPFDIPVGTIVRIPRS
jgi:nucleoid-associated protein YgaU